MRQSNRFLCCLTAMFFLFCHSLYAQEDWTLVADSELGVKFYQKKVEWNDTRNGVYQEVILLRVVNQTAAAQEISWQTDVYYDGKCSGCGSEESRYTLNLAAGETREGQLVQGQNQGGLRIFVRYLNGRKARQLTDYKIHTIQAISE